LLTLEIKLAANCSALFDHVTCSNDMSLQPINFLADISLGRKQRRFLMKPFGVEFTGFHQLVDLAFELCLDRVASNRCTAFRPQNSFLDTIDMTAQHFIKLSAFFGAMGFHLIKRLAETFEDRS